MLDAGPAEGACRDWGPGPAIKRPTPNISLSTRRPTSSYAKPPFLVLALVLLAVFLVTRLPFFWYYPRVDLSQDSGSYLDIVDTMRQGRWPHFVFRTPGYPLFVWVITSCVDRWLVVILVQNLLSLLASLCLVYAVYRCWRVLALPAALAMCGFLGSSQVLIYDISLLSDSLYTSTVILAVALLFLAFGSNRPIFFSLASACMAFAILVRPAGMYFAVIYAAVAGYLLWNRYRRDATLGFLVPFPAVLLSLCAYNSLTIGRFTVSPFAEANLAGATALFWEPDPRLPEQANTALKGLQESYRKMGITQEDIDTVRTSWDPDRLFAIYAKAYNRLIWSAGWGSGTRFGGNYLQSRTYIRDVSLIAIRRHPDLYAKYVWVNMVMFFEGIGYKFDIYSSLTYRARGQLPSDARAYELEVGGDSRAPSGGTPVHAAEGTGVPALERCLRGLLQAWQSFHGAVYQSVLWTWAYFVVLALSAAQLLRSGGRHLGAFLLLALTLVPLGASLVVCLVETATDRYSYPTQFVCYLSVALAPLLWDAAGTRFGDGARDPSAH